MLETLGKVDQNVDHKRKRGAVSCDKMADEAAEGGVQGLTALRLGITEFWHMGSHQAFDFAAEESKSQADKGGEQNNRPKTGKKAQFRVSRWASETRRVIAMRWPAAVNFPLPCIAKANCLR